MPCSDTLIRRVLARALAAGVLAAAWLNPLPAGEPPVRVERARYLMGTICRGTAYHADPGRAARSLGEAFDAIAELEAVLSTWRLESELSRLNRSAGDGPVRVSIELAGYLDRALRLASATGGAFDPTVGALVEAWDLRGEGRIPTRGELARALRATGFRHVTLDRSAGTVAYARPGLRVEAGGLGKGYALDRAAAVLRRRGIDAALLDFGGQLLAIGAPPGEEAWEVAVAGPHDRDRPVARVRLRDASLATSGQSERGFRVEGRWIGHVLDPGRGRPVERRGSVTVLAPTAAEADAYSTALFVMGPQKGREWLEERPGVKAAWLEPGSKRKGREEWRISSRTRKGTTPRGRCGRGPVGADSPSR